MRLSIVELRASEGSDSIQECATTFAKGASRMFVDLHRCFVCVDRSAGAGHLMVCLICL